MRKITMIRVLLEDRNGYVQYWDLEVENGDYQKVIADFKRKYMRKGDWFNWEPIAWEDSEEE